MGAQSLHGIGLANNQQRTIKPFETEFLRRMDGCVLRGGIHNGVISNE